MKIKYDFFIAYSTTDHLIAKELYSLLTHDFDVFLDSESLLPGDIWDISIPEAQLNSRITLVILTINTENSFYQKEEILSAIELLRNQPDEHRVIPIYFDGTPEKKIMPYGLKRIQGIKARTGYIQLVKNELCRTLLSLGSKNLISYEYEKENKNLKEGPVEKITENGKDKKEFERHIKNIIKEHQLKNISTFVVYIDVDKFDSINKVYGSSIGDQVVIIINDIIKESVGSSYSCNFSGDQFIVCPKCFTEIETIGLVKNIQNKLKSFDWFFISSSFYVTCSFGYAELDLLNRNKIAVILNEWIIRAIYGCKKAKRNGGNCSFKGPTFLPRTEILNYNLHSS